MRHIKGRKKLNRRPAHRRAMLRNQVMTLILYGSLTSTKPRIKEVRRLAEKMVTIARQGNTFHARRRARMILPYSEEALDKLFTQIAPKYVQRPGGYTRFVPLGQRVSDTAPMAKLTWVEDEVNAS